MANRFKRELKYKIIAKLNIDLEYSSKEKLFWRIIELVI